MSNVKVNLNLDAFRGDVAKAMQEVTKNIALAIQGEAMQNAPVDTGFLKNSIAIAPDGSDYVVYVGAEYGYFMEAKRSYLGAAADNIGGNQAEAIAKAVLGQAI